MVGLLIVPAAVSLKSIFFSLLILVAKDFCQPEISSGTSRTGALMLNLAVRLIISIVISPSTWAVRFPDFNFQLPASVCINCIELSGQSTTCDFIFVDISLDDAQSLTIFNFACPLPPKSIFNFAGFPVNQGK